MSSKPKLAELLTEYLEVKSDQIKLKVLSALARLSTVIISFALIAGLVFFILLFVNFYLSNLLNSYLESTYYGYLIVSGVYLLFLIITLFLIKKEKLQKWIDELMIKTLEEKDEEELI